MEANEVLGPDECIQVDAIKQISTPQIVVEAQSSLLCGQHALNNLMRNYGGMVLAVYVTDRHDSPVTNEEGVKTIDLYQFCILRNASTETQVITPEMKCNVHGNFDHALLEEAVKLTGATTHSLRFAQSGGDEDLLRSLRNLQDGKISGLIVNIQKAHYTAVIRTAEGLMEIDSLTPKKLIARNLDEMRRHLMAKGYVYAFTVKFPKAPEALPDRELPEREPSPPASSRHAPPPAPVPAAAATIEPEAALEPASAVEEAPGNHLVRPHRSPRTPSPRSSPTRGRGKEGDHLVLDLHLDVDPHVQLDLHLDLGKQIFGRRGRTSPSGEHEKEKMADRPLTREEKVAERKAKLARAAAKERVSHAAAPQVENRKTISGARNKADQELTLAQAEKLKRFEAAGLVVREGSSDRCDIAWGVAEILRGIKEDGAEKGVFTIDSVAEMQLELFDFLNGTNGARFEKVKYVDPNHKIGDQKQTSSCVLFEQPQDEAGEPQEVPQTGLRPHQITCWHIFRAMAAAQRPDYEALRDSWTQKNATKATYEDRDIPEAYKGFDVNMSRTDGGERVKHNPRLTPKGVLVNHSTGTGKTAVAVAALQAFWFQTDRPLIYVSTQKAVSFVIGKRADDASCTNVATRSEYTRLAQLYFPTTLGDDNAAFDETLSRQTDPTQRAKSKCVQTYLGNPGTASSRMKALTFVQLAEFIEKSKENPEELHSEICKTPTIINGVSPTVPKFSASAKANVFNAVIIVDEAHNLLRSYGGEGKPSSESEKEDKACNTIFEYFNSEKSDSNTLIFLTATPAENVPDDVDKLEGLLRRSSEEGGVNVVSYFNAEHNTFDFPKLKIDGDATVTMTHEQMIAVAELDDTNVQLKRSTISEAAVELLPSSFGLAGGSGRGSGRAKGGRRVGRAQAGGGGGGGDGEARAGGGGNGGEDADGDNSGEMDEATKEGKNSAELSNRLDAELFDRKRIEWQTLIDRGTAFPPFNPASIKAQEPPVFARREKPKTFERAAFETNGSFARNAPKLAKVADSIADNLVKTFVYSAYTEASEGLSMLLEHSHKWRHISDSVLTELKAALNFEVEIPEEKEEAMDEAFTAQNRALVKERLEALVLNAETIVEKLLTPKSGAESDLVELNGHIPKSLLDLKEQVKTCKDSLLILDLSAEDFFSKAAKISSLVIGSRASLVNMQKVIEKIGSADIATRLTTILNKNKPAIISADDTVPSGGFAKKRFVRINNTNAQQVLAIFNHFLNRDGDLIMAIIADGTAIEGLNLKTTQRVIACEPVVSAAKLQQLIGRARRYCSHAELPKNKQTVSFQMFVSENDSAFETSITREHEEYDAFNEEYQVLRQATFDTANERTREKEANLRGEVDSAAETYNKLLREANEMREALASLRIRHKQALSEGSALHPIAARLFGKIVADEREFALALSKVQDAARQIVATSVEYDEFCRSDKGIKESLARLDEMNNKRRGMLVRFEEKYGVSISEDIRLLIRSAEVIKKEQVLRAESELAERLQELRDSAADIDVLDPIMKGFENK